MNREYTPTNTLQNYVSKMTLDKNRGVYLPDTEPSPRGLSTFSIFLFGSIIGIGVVIILGYCNTNLFTTTNNIIERISNLIQYVNNILFNGGPVYETENKNKANTDVVGEIVPDVQGSGVNESAYPTNSVQNTNEQSFHIVNTAPRLVKQQQEYEDKQYMNDVQYNTPVGYCFIGQQNDKRYCSGIIEAGQCASGDIFPTMDKCINPNIRISRKI
jgi:hypothetical protein